jgi:hypothetical protein
MWKLGDKNQMNTYIINIQQPQPQPQQWGWQPIA